MSDQLTQADDVFIWKGISILQNQNVFKVGTDALLLGSWVPKIVPKVNAILDVGSGTGILSLIMHRAFPDARIIAVDQETSAAALSAYNFSKSEKAHLISAVVHDFFSFEPRSSFDLIVCNPPYFFSPNHKHAGPFSDARHAKDDATFWMIKMASLISAHGHVCLVLPAWQATDWIKAGNDSGLFAAHRLNVSSFINDQAPKRVLLHFTTQLVKPGFEQICIYKDHDQYTEAYKIFMAHDDQRSLT